MFKRLIDLLRTRRFRKINVGVIYSLVAIEVAFLLISIPDFRLNGDEAWSAEDSYFMSQKGYSTSNLFSGYIMEDVRVVVQHKLLVYLGAALFRILHYDLWVFRLIPLCSFLILMVFFVRYQQKYLPAGGLSTSLHAGSDTSQRERDSLQIFLGIAIVLAMHESFYFAKVARPEMLVTLLGFLSFYLLQKYLVSGKILLSTSAGFLAGLSMLAHLNGAIFIAAGFVLLLLRGKFGASCAFAIASLIAFSPYIMDAYWHFEIFKIQLNSDPNKTHFTLLKPLLNLSREHERLFRRPEIIIPSALFFFNLIVNRKYLFRAGAKELTIYTLLLMLFLGLIVEDKTMKYSTYLVPFWGIIIAGSVMTMNANQKVMTSTNTVLLSSLFITGLYWQATSVFQKEEYPSLNKLIAHDMPLHVTCVAPMNFIFNEIAEFKIFSNYLVGYEKFGDTINIKSVSGFCRANNCQYVVFNKYGDPWYYLHDYRDTTNLFEHFEIVAANNDFCVLKYRNEPIMKTVARCADSTSLLEDYISYMSERAAHVKKGDTF